jgi:hypothetical protein
MAPPRGNCQGGGRTSIDKLTNLLMRSSDTRYNTGSDNAGSTVRLALPIQSRGLGGGAWVGGGLGYC